MEFDALDFLTGMLVALVVVKLYVVTQCRNTLRGWLANLLKGRGHAPLVRQLPMEQRSVPADWIKSGAPVFHSCEYGTSPDQRSFSGIWSCEGPAVFEWQFGCDESVVVLDGRVEIDYLGKHFVLEPGGSALFYGGTRALWNVPQYVRKSYMLHQPHYLVRWARRLLGVVRG